MIVYVVGSRCMMCVMFGIVDDCIGCGCLCDMLL